MSYADAKLDLTPVSIACLSGGNGAGKSALLDAVTWALWESARSSSDELIRLGSRDMWVEVVFSLESQTYRARRSRQKLPKGASRGTLDLQVEEGSGDRACWRSLTAPTMRETQRKICDVLRMDYDTFINSVYLRQGKADEFTTRAPAERKQVLSEILGLSYFDRLQELAREISRDLKTRLEHIERTLTQLPELEQRLADMDTQISTMQSDAAECLEKTEFYETTLGKLQGQLQELRLAGQKCEAGDSRVGELESDVASLSKRDQELSARLSDMQLLIERAAEIEDVCRRFEQVKSLLEAADKAGLESQDLTGQRLKLQSELVNMRSRLEVEREHLQLGQREQERKLAQLTKETSEREKLQASYKQFKELVAKEAELAKTQESYQQLVGRSDDLNSSVSEARIRLEAELEQKKVALEDLESIIASSQAIGDEEAGLNQESQEMDRLEAEFELVEEKGLRVKSDLESAQHRVSELRLKQEENEHKISELAEHAHSTICPLCSSPIVDRSAVISRYRKENVTLGKEIEALTTQAAQLEGDRADLRKTYVDLRQRLDKRKSLDTRIGQFKEKLSAIARAEHSHQDLKAAIDRLEARLNSQDYAQIERESLVNVRAEIHKLDFDPVIYSSLQAQIRMMRHLEGRHQQLQRDVSELKKIESELPAARVRLEDIDTQLSAETYGQAVRARISELQQEITTLAYNRHDHEKLREELQSLIASGEQFKELERARHEQPIVENELSSVRQTLASKSQLLAQLKIDILGWQQQLAGMPEIELRLKELEPIVEAWREKKTEISKQLAVLESRQRQLADDTTALAARKKELDERRAELDDYTFLAEAFGKKGLQAVIIENAVPEIEGEANRILSRISNNQMHVALATQYKTKTGSVVETLDLLIGDELGTRNYELYSGGEAFKVDFAVRVALSRLLARRAGAKLETLIIDEGFGSQDESSRERMVKAINSIKGDFARILVITHISEVKEMFPAQIQVTKDDGTSRLTVLV